VLSKELRKTLDNKEQIELPQRHVIDGGCLLHRVVWGQTGSYLDIVNRYINFVKAHYGTNCTVVFDGYDNGPSIKDHEHVRRNKNSSPDIDVVEHNPVYKNQSTFFVNVNNKIAFVKLLSCKLLEFGYTVKHAVNDADTLIVRTALEFASQQQPVTVVADDTDVLVLLVYHFEQDMAEICMLSEVARRRTARIAVTPVRAVRNAIGDEMSKQLLVTHAISGCDTTSALFGHGKATIFRIL
jgi:hypothetical protein